MLVETLGIVETEVGARKSSLHLHDSLAIRD
jgi:hypothetical protein